MPPAGLRAAAASVGTPSFSCLSLHRARLLNTHILFRRVWPHTKFPRRTCRSLVPSASILPLLTGSSRRELYPTVFWLSFQTYGRLQEENGPALQQVNHIHSGITWPTSVLNNPDDSFWPSSEKPSPGHSSASDNPMARLAWPSFLPR